MRRQVGRIAAVLVSGFSAYKVTIAVFADEIPSQPFHGFGVTEWVAWIVSPSELAFILTALIIEYAVLYFVTRRLPTGTLCVWSGLLGAYVAGLLFPFDLLATVDNLPDRYWPQGLFGAVLEILVFFGIVPLAVALGLLALPRPKRHQRAL